ncbi:hypothetical protein conserved [Leishmania donovani]|uniref:Hypothetical_protein_conserved n=1 Tax=Leishmania donovani TaxID=5661 RepID=A0A6J8FNI1_LEIDO|nr:hypothetical protein conserved [Leishmania donovani]VDZ47433.1 hypothetical_protein_conserved [Leishmania donovani]
MPEVSDVWLLGVVLTGETTFWLCEPTHLKPLAEDWKAINCRWLYPVLENLSDFADVSGFESTDAVYEVDWVGTSRVLRPATLAWNVRGKRRKVGDTTYVFVPAEEIKQLDEAFKRFVKLEATMKPPPPRCVTSSPSAAETPGPAEAKTMLTLHASPSAPVHQEEDGKDGKPLVTAASLLSTQSSAPTAGEVPQETVTKAEDERSASRPADIDGSIASSSAPHPRAPHRRGVTSLSSFPSHKRQTPHRGTTIYQAPVHRKPTGEHCSSEAFGWTEMYLVHRGSVDYLCPKATGNIFGFRLDRVMHDGFPVFLLFSSSHNNSEVIDPSARGVPVFEKAQLNGEAGEGAVRSSVLVVTRLSSKKHQPYYRTDTGRTTAGSRRRRRRGEDDSTTTEEDEDVDDLFDDDDDDDDSESEEVYGEEHRVGTQGSRRRAGDEAATTATPTAGTAAPAVAKKPKTEAKDPAGESAVAASASRRKEKRKADAAANKPLQAVSVNFWADPQYAAPAPEQLAREFPFKSEGSDTPQTVVFSNGICVTYTASTAAKHAPQEKKRKTAKHGGAAASSEDMDLSMLNEHILNAFAQVRKDCV